MIATIELDRNKDACCGDDCCSDNEHSSDRASSIDPLESNVDIKYAVRANYGQIATAAVQGGGCGCGCGDSSSIAPDSYHQEEGYADIADLGLGCGLPNQFADFKSGEHVLDLGSGAGIDAFIARKSVGAEGRVTGVDMTPAMIDLARVNAEKLGYDNINFELGDIEALPVTEGSVDVAISNCVFNLVPDKKKAFAEVHRVLKVGGRFSISDIVYSGELPESVRSSVGLYVGCVAGAVSLESYLNLLLESGFTNVAVRSISTVEVDNFGDNLEGDSDEEALKEFVSTGGRILSITVTGEKRLTA